MPEQLFQIGIKAIVRNETGEILLLRHTAGKNYESYWDFPGGRMNEDETFEQTLQRELTEEIGLSYSGTPKFVTAVLSNHKISYGEMKTGLVLLVYEVQLPAGNKVQLGEGEEEDRLVSPAKAAELLIDKYPPEFCEIIAKI